MKTHIMPQAGVWRFNDATRAPRFTVRSLSNPSASITSVHEPSQMFSFQVTPSQQSGVFFVVFTPKKTDTLTQTVTVVSMSDEAVAEIPLDIAVIYGSRLGIRQGAANVVSPP